MSLNVYIKKKGDEEYWNSNITHNMAMMANAIPLPKEGKTLYDFIWRPEETGRKIDTTKMLDVLREGISYMIDNRKCLLMYEPENGWGSYGSLLEFLIEYKDACEDNPDCEIEVSR